MAATAKRGGLRLILYLSSSKQQCGTYRCPQPMRRANPPTVLFHASSACRLLAQAGGDRTLDEATRLSAQNVALLLPPFPSFFTLLFRRVFVLVYQHWANAPALLYGLREAGKSASSGKMSLLRPWLQRIKRPPMRTSDFTVIRTFRLRITTTRGEMKR